MTSFTQNVTCVECGHEFDIQFIATQDKEVDEINPITCPKCLGRVFHSRFYSDPNNWFGVYGSNGVR